MKEKARSILQSKQPIIYGIVAIGFVAFEVVAGCFVSAARTCGSSTPICMQPTGACPLNPPTCCTPPLVVYTDVDNACAGKPGKDNLDANGTFHCVQTCNVPHPCAGIGSFPVTRDVGVLYLHKPAGNNCTGTANCNPGG